jgi:hypothetical protein
MNRKLWTFGFLMVMGIGFTIFGAAVNPQVLSQEISAKIQPDVKNAFAMICDDLTKPEMLNEARLNEEALRAAIQKAFPKGIPGMNSEAGLFYLSSSLKSQIQSRFNILQKPAPPAKPRAESAKSVPAGDASSAAVIDDGKKSAIIQLAPGGDGSNFSIIIIYRKIIGNLDAIAAKAGAKAKLKFGGGAAGAIDGGGIK